MKKILIAVSALSIGTAAASAADLPARTYTKAPPMAAPCIWCGFYVGVSGGWGGSGSSQWSNLSALGTDPLEGVFVTRAANHDINGGFGGGQIGYNWQFPGGLNGPGSGWLVGVEADIQGAGLRGSSNSLSFAGDTDNLHTASASSRLNWFGTLRGRLGYTVGNGLFYGTGGLAFGGVRNTLNVAEADGSDCAAGINAVACSVSSTANNSSTRTGYVVGAGIEYLLTPNWSFKIEYQYIDLGTVTQAASATVQDNAEPPESTFGTHHVNERFNTARIGVNYHFGGPVVARY